MLSRCAIRLKKFQFTAQSLAAAAYPAPMPLVPELIALMCTGQHMHGLGRTRTILSHKVEVRLGCQAASGVKAPGFKVLVNLFACNKVYAGGGPKMSWDKCSKVVYEFV